MSTYFEEEMMEAITKPNEYSGHTSNDGSPLTNYEYYKRKKRFN